MSPTATQDVLPAVEQIFQGIQQIPLERIRPNPDNPGPSLTEEQIAEQAANLEVSPLRNPIKVMPDPAKPLAEGVRLHAENPNLKADGQPWTPGDFNWVILSGELRYRAFGRLNRASIPAFVLNPNPEEAAEIIHQDNDVRDRGWFAAYQSIENLIKANPNLTQREIAARLKLHIPQVNRALQLLPLLNPESKALIVTNCNNQNKGNKGISESVAAQLAALGPGTGLKRGVKAAGAETQKLWPYPAIPPETQDLVHRALAMAIDHQMTEAGVKGLVAWVKAGNKPEDYVPSGKLGVRSEKLGVKAPATASTTETPAQEPDLHSQVGTPHLPTGPQAGRQALVVPSQGAEGDKGAKLGSAIASHELGKKLHIPAQAMNRLFPQLSRLFQWTRGLFEKAGIQNKFWATAITMLVLLWAAGMMIHYGERLINRVFLYTASSWTTEPTQKPAEASIPIVPANQPIQQPQKLVSHKPKPSTHLPTGPQAGRRGLVAPSQSVDRNGDTKKGLAPNSSLLTPNSGSSGEARTIPAWAQDEIPVAKDFAGRFYGISYSNWDDTLKFLRAQMTGDTTAAMVDRYFPASLQKDMQIRMLVQYFSADKPPRIVRGEGDSAEILAQGTVTTDSRMGRNPKTLSTKPVALLMSFRHAEGFGSKIEKVTEVDPSTVASKTPSEDLGKAIDGTVKDISHAVNIASDATSTADKAKKLLGF